MLIIKKTQSLVQGKQALLWVQLLPFTRTFAHQSTCKNLPNQDYTDHSKDKEASMKWSTSSFVHFSLSRTKFFVRVLLGEENIFR